jgi:hypothetical protein
VPPIETRNTRPRNSGMKELSGFASNDSNTRQMVKNIAMMIRFIKVAARTNNTVFSFLFNGEPPEKNRFLQRA